MNVRIFTKVSRNVANLYAFIMHYAPSQTGLTAMGQKTKPQTRYTKAKDR